MTLEAMASLPKGSPRCITSSTAGGPDSWVERSSTNKGRRNGMSVGTGCRGDAGVGHDTVTFEQSRNLVETGRWPCGFLGE